MSAEKTGFRFEIGHVLFIDIVGYSKLLITAQSELLGKLTRAVLATQQLRAAEAENKLIRLPTGDGMALVFRNTSEVPAQCAAELAQRLKSLPELRVRMGIHSGPINEVTDVNGRTSSHFRRNQIESFRCCAIPCPFWDPIRNHPSLTRIDRGKQTVTGYERFAWAIVPGERTLPTPSGPDFRQCRVMASTSRDCALSVSGCRT